MEKFTRLETPTMGSLARAATKAGIVAAIQIQTLPAHGMYHKHNTGLPYDKSKLGVLAAGWGACGDTSIKDKRQKWNRYDIRFPLPDTHCTPWQPATMRTPNQLENENVSSEPGKKGENNL